MEHLLDLGSICEKLNQDKQALEYYTQALEGLMKSKNEGNRRAIEDFPDEKYINLINKVEKLSTDLKIENNILETKYSEIIQAIIQLSDMAKISNQNLQILSQKIKTDDKL